MAYGIEPTCPNTITPPFCDTLKTMNDDDWAYCMILFVDSSYTDSACDKTKETCGPTANTSSDSIPPYIFEYTQKLFGTYDLRWPDDLNNRAPVPLEGGRQDMVSGQNHSPNSGYAVHARKSTIDSVAREPYVLFIEHWSPQIWTSLFRSKNQLSRMRGAEPVPFNLKGQRVPFYNARAFKIPGLLDVPGR